MKRVMVAAWYLIVSVGGALLFMWGGQVIAQVTPFSEQRFDPLSVFFIVLIFFGWLPRVLPVFVLSALMTVRMTGASFPEVVGVYALLYGVVRYLLTHVMTHRTLWALVVVTVCVTMIQQGLHTLLQYLWPHTNARIAIMTAGDFVWLLVTQSVVVSVIFLIHRTYATSR